MFILNFLLKIFGLVSISNNQYKEYLCLKNNPKVIPMFGPPEQEFTEIFIICDVLGEWGVTTSRLKGSIVKIDTFNKRDFVDFIKSTLCVYNVNLELNKERIKQLHSVYNLTKDINIIYKDFNLSLNIKFVTLR